MSELLWTKQAWCKYYQDLLCLYYGSGIIICSRLQQQTRYDFKTVFMELSPEFSGELSQYDGCIKFRKCPGTLSPKLKMSLDGSTHSPVFFLMNCNDQSMPSIAAMIVITFQIGTMVLELDNRHLYKCIVSWLLPIICMLSFVWKLCVKLCWCNLPVLKSKINIFPAIYLPKKCFGVN